MLRSLLLTLVLLLPTTVLADDAPPARCNVHGCWPPGGGCNVHGCWTNGGGCNVHGCWNSSMGACNVHGCSDWGSCNVHGCPPPPPRRPSRGFVPRGQRPGPAPVYAPASDVAPSPAPAPPPMDYARDAGESLREVRQFSQGGLRFDYPAQLAVSVTPAAKGIVVALNGPRSLDFYVTRIVTTRAPEVVRGEIAQGLGGDLLKRGLRSLGATAISADFREGSRQGVRDRFDNRDDIMIQDCFAWRRADGDVIVILFTYKSGDAGLAYRMIPVITRSL